MITEDQTAVIDFLGSSATHGGLAVERIETHAALVFLAGGRAYKLKRAVRFDYLDFSTAERRRLMCEAEVRLNRRTAPQVYIGVRAVTRTPGGGLALGGQGDPVDWVVEMNRFDQTLVFDRLAAAGRLDAELMASLATAVAAFHARAEPREDHGGQAGMSWVIEGNSAGFAEFGSDCLDPAVCAAVTAASRDEVRRQAKLLESRRRGGFVRQCHGDLHLRNIVLLDAGATLFDGVEFNDEIACTDVLYDLAFLLMDLWRRRLPGHASVVWNRYLSQTGDLEGLPLMPLFLSCRAAVRAKTSATAAGVQRDSRARAELQDLARRYLDMAQMLLRPPAPSMIAIGGWSGSGKSTLARALAPMCGAVPGAVVIRSDEIRKELLGRPALERLGAEGYAPAVSARVYDTLVERARRTLEGGFSVVADAVFARQVDREAIERTAADGSIPFHGLWLHAPESTLIGRVEGRSGDASDADAAIVRGQGRQDPGTVSWQTIDASRTTDRVLADARALVQGRQRDRGVPNA